MVDRKEDIESNIIKNMESVLDEIFDDDEDKHQLISNSNLTTPHTTDINGNLGIGIDFSQNFFPNTSSKEASSPKIIPKLFVNDQPQEQEPHPSQSIKSLLPSLSSPYKAPNNPMFSSNEAPEDEDDKLMRTKDHIDQEDYERFKGKFFSIVTSQNGSRFMQRAYVNTSREILQMIFNELQEHLNELMIAPYANYFCQKFYSILSQENKLRFLWQLSKEIIFISKSKIGTYPLQAVLDLLRSKEEKEIIIKALSGSILELCNDEMGVHVIEKIVLCFEEDSISEIYDTIIDNFTSLAQNSYGLFVCKKIIICARNFSTLARIREKIKDNSMMLIKNQYGNYTIQVAIENWPNDLCQPLIESFSGNFFSLSMEKYSSNVIEKCLEKSDEKQLLNFIEEISKTNCIINLMKNSYGNYVIQKALKLSNGKIKTKFLSVIKKNLENLNDKKLIAKWKGIINGSSHLNIDGNIPGGVGNDGGSLNGSFSSNKSGGSPCHVSTRICKSNGGSPFIGAPIQGPMIMHSPVMGPMTFSTMIPGDMPRSPVVPMSKSPQMMSSMRLAFGSPFALGGGGYMPHQQQQQQQQQQFNMNMQQQYQQQMQMMTQMTQMTQMQMQQHAQMQHQQQAQMQQHYSPIPGSPVQNMQWRPQMYNQVQQTQTQPQPPKYK